METGGSNDDIGGRLLFDLKSSLNMILEYVSTLEGDDRKNFIKAIDDVTIEMRSFPEDLGLRTDGENYE